MNIKRNIIFFIFISQLFSKSAVDIQNEIDNNNKSLIRLENAINQLEKDIKSIESSEIDLIKYIDMLNQKIDYREKQISILINQDQSISELILNTKNNMYDEEKKLRILKYQLKNRTLYLYKHGRSNLISKMININNWSNLLNKIKYYKTILKYEKNLNKKIKGKILDLKNKEQKLENDRLQQEAILAEAQRIYDNLEKDKKNKDNQINKVRSDKNVLKENLNLKKKEMSAVEKLIKQLISDVKTAKKREEEIAKERSLLNKSTSGNFAKMKGKLDWPTNGSIINKFGMQKNVHLNTITENIGIDIQTSKGTSVFSVLDGVVSIITYLRNYGNTIIISHGGGYYTVYSNLENILISENEYILSNIKLGTVGKSENPSISNTYYLHFEVWKDETKLNAELWLKKINDL